PHLGARARELLADLRADARRHERKVTVPLLGFDKDPEALEAARRNVKAAKLAEEIRLEEGDATKLPPLPEGGGLILTNPPYGDRLGSGGQKGMKSFYFKLGDSLRQPGWRVWVLSGNPAFESAFHARPRSRRDLWNGPIACTLLGYSAVPARAGAEGSEAPLGAPEEALDVAPVRPEDEGEEQG
ncbi:MAG: THUMP domain-containing class I SAM-dependent RNA methyltransferase, partial [Archangium sp.]